MIIDDLGRNGPKQGIRSGHHRIDRGDPEATITVSAIFDNAVPGFTVTGFEQQRRHVTKRSDICRIVADTKVATQVELLGVRRHVAVIVGDCVRPTYGKLTIRKCHDVVGEGCRTFCNRAVDHTGQGEGHVAGCVHGDTENFIRCPRNNGSISTGDGGPDQIVVVAGCSNIIRSVVQHDIAAYGRCQQQIIVRRGRARTIRAIGVGGRERPSETHRCRCRRRAGCNIGRRHACCRVPLEIAV